MPEDTLEQNKAIVRRMLEAFNTGNLGVVAEVFDQNIQDRSRRLGFESELQRAHPIRRVQTEILREEDAFPDREFKEEVLIAEGDTVVLRWSMTGTNRGRVLGRGPTGRRITTQGTEIVRIKDGKIVEHIGDDGAHLLHVLWQLDMLDRELLRQLDTGHRGLGAGNRTAPPL
jgi:predicted ester cyclase